MRTAPVVGTMVEATLAADTRVVEIMVETACQSERLLVRARGVWVQTICFRQEGRAKQNTQNVFPKVQAHGCETSFSLTHIEPPWGNI